MFRDCSLTVLLCERVFRGIREPFLQGSSCLRCGPELFTAIPAVPRVFSAELFFSVSECSAVFENRSCKVPHASAVVLNCSQPFQLFCECSLIVLLCERVFRGIREPFLQGSSCLRSAVFENRSCKVPLASAGPELFTAIPGVPRVFSDCSSL